MSTTDPLGAPPSDSEHSVTSISKCDTSTSQPSGDEWTDDDDFPISPLSNRTPPRGTHWARFFPELSSHFSLVSPISTTIPKVTPFSLLAEMQAIDHQNRQNFSDSSTRTDSPSFSEDTFDTTSSCYSRRSSVTSLGSELAGPYKSADAFSVISPTAAGVFDDDTAPVLVGSASKLVAKRPSLAEVRNKPLPREPPIALAPLSVRHRGPHPLQACEHPSSDRPRTTTPASPATQLCPSQPTLSQAAEELENVLAGITEQRHNESQLLSSQIFNGPLQISRGNMDMIATRPAPRPPTNIASNKSHDNSSQKHIYKKLERDLRKTMKKSTKNKGPFSFAVPGFSRKYTNLHLRSFSSSSLKSDVESPSFRPQRPPRPETIHDEPEDTAEVAESSCLPIPSQRQRPSSFCSERELRLKLPRLQTKQVRSHEDLTSTSSSVENKPVAERPIPRIRTNNVEEKIFVSSSKSARLITSDSLFELEGGLPQRMVYELDAGLSSPQPKITISVHKPREPTTGQLPDDIALKIMEQVSSLDDLFNLAVVSKQYYRVFKQHELQLMKTAVFRMSPPAWELREMSPPWDSEWQILVDPDAPVPEYTPTLYLQRYAQDIYTLARLKSIILARCNTFLRQQTINGLTGKDDARAAEIDDAFWRIWTFCRIFGCGKNRENDIVGQMDWLNGGVMAQDRNSIVTTSLTEPFGMNNVLFEPPEGFGRGNGGGLSQSQLYDMTEIWTCLAVLLQPIHGRRTEARKAGIFNGLDIAENDTVKEEAMIEEWTYYVLTLGPSAVLSIGSICPFDNAEATFQTAQSIGLTKWEPSDSDISRSTFLKEAVSRAYKVREGGPSLNALRLSNASSTSSRSSAGREKTSQTSSNTTDSNQSNRRRQAVFAAQLRNRRNQQQNNPGNPITFAEERPISSYAMIMRRLEGLPSEQPPPPPSQSVSSLGSQTPRYCPPAPVQYSQLPPPPPPTAHPVFYRPQVLDPVDQAIHMMVHELGFKEEDAKWALKITDNGEGIDANAAVALLTREQERYEQRRSGRFAFRSKSPSLLESVINSQESVNSGWRWA
ncbi:uncharacterized protein CDV56_104558 [Aspergillus thermomutatus]|uniref:F-box domain-containing protein n=1 Tax=Aspergillus thermomutatus TaxID=41047 RepID=A0A397GBI2_ASPTH|nr:uncharacterized protein CDV56_104558 [Aspergillus thermomutatus]RHZ46978.1 hypothetical protein CDV56_104558 [Aspergillus thermomutatus]